MNTEHTSGEWSINTWPRADSHIAIGAPGTPLIVQDGEVEGDAIGQRPAGCGGTGQRR